MPDALFNETLIASVINRALQLDPDASAKLAALNGKRIALTLEPRTTPWVFRIDDSRLAFDGASAPTDCDVRLSGTLSGFLRLFRPDGEKSEGERLYIEGDLHAAQTFQRVMASLSPDFEHALKTRFGEPLGAKLHDALQTLRRLGEAGREQAENKLADYLQRTFVSRADYLAREADIQALERRIAALEAQLGAQA
ncbi:MAG: SCP2 sterol-binding domain-containing protein [Cardiobacteriaceae bacterium]|nr:SCP2 sterol-binding domain-containing protein [Cardiobacteriaceae bacterium]